MSEKHFNTVQKAILFIDQHQHQQPSLAEIASHCELSEYHFQRLFKQWAGISPKQFLLSLTREEALKRLLSGEDLLSVSYAVGLSSPSRLHDLFVHIDAVTPGQIKSRGKNMVFRFGVCDTLLGHCFIVTTDRGIHQLMFIDDQTDSQQALNDVIANWPEAQFIEDNASIMQIGSQLFSANTGKKNQLKLWVKGTEFQMKVWQALLKIPSGQLTSYNTIAKTIGQPNASRAVGTAIGKNPIALLIPCHRVIQQTGKFGQYRWGADRKKALLAIEANKFSRL